MARQYGRRTFLAASGVAATTVVAGCSDEDPVGSDQTDTGDDGDVDAGDQQLQMMQIAQQTLDPIGINGAGSARSNWQTHEQLFTYADGTPPAEPQLAEDYEISDDNLTYTFSLKEGVSFHDGSEMTADDVVYSWRRLAESENNRGHADVIVGGTMSIEHEVDDDDDLVPDSLALEAVDDYTVEMTLESPFHGTLGTLADPRFSIIPEGIVGDIEGYDGEMDYGEYADGNIPGTGPFEFTEWDRGNEIVVERFDDYHGEVADIEGIRWQIIEDPNAEYNRAMNRNADLFELPRSQFDPSLLEVEEELDGDRRLGSYGPVSNDETLNYGEATLLRTQYLLLNTLEVEKPARQAIAYLINQEDIADRAVRGQGTPAYFITPPSAFPGGPEAYHDHAESAYPYGYGTSDIDAARQVMEEAGYGPDDAYETSIQHPSDSQASEWGEIAGELRDRAESAHIDISIEEAPSTTLTNRAIEGDIEVFGTWNALEWPEADAVLQYAYPTEFTWTRWGQGDDGMSDAAQAALDAWERYEDHRTPSEENQAVRNETYLTLEEMNWEDVTMLPLYHPIKEHYWYDRVEGYEINGSQYSHSFNDISLSDRS
ncbi:ABC transporter substrate-binding protein [Natrarchaeobius sp. A-rgal3]|uniref:ABC transporter substrate-binding protein n=1 Tax=Natrarchaeobius versutus TaxID=1679078 RepID=UPI0035104334